MDALSFLCSPGFIWVTGLFVDDIDVCIGSIGHVLATAGIAVRQTTHSRTVLTGALIITTFTRI